VTVLDAGLPGHWEDFCAVLARLGHTVADIDAVLITHHDSDHAGNAERMLRRARRAESGLRTDLPGFPAVGRALHGAIVKGRVELVRPFRFEGGRGAADLADAAPALP
jgi:glyoxylase-like metal-dependent hydrolase (beta-lactamase superfamily II)